MKAITTVAVLATACAIGACSMFGGKSEPVVVSSSPTAVTMQFKEGQLDQATTSASSVCQANGRVARLRNVTPTRDGQRVGTYDCV